MIERKKCAHATCGCAALPLVDYCGDACRLADKQVAQGAEPLLRCVCGHPDCGGEPEVPAETQGILIASEALAEM